MEKEKRQKMAEFPGDGEESEKRAKPKNTLDNKLNFF